MTFADIEEAKVDLGPEIDVIGLDQEADLVKEVCREDQEVNPGGRTEVGVVDIILIGNWSYSNLLLQFHL